LDQAACLILLTRRALTIFIKILTIPTAAFLHYGDITDTNNLLRVIQEARPDEIYNLAAQSHVADGHAGDGGKQPFRSD
jgi:GDP-D-mannose dehydratase